MTGAKSPNRSIDQCLQIWHYKWCQIEKKIVCAKRKLRLSYRSERKAQVEQKAEIYFNSINAHDDAVTVQGLDDLFKWASETVADGLDGKQRRAREQNIKKQVLSIIHRSADMQAQTKYVNEMGYLQRRVIALQGVLLERSEEVLSLKQVVIAQYFQLQRIPELEEKIVQLEAQSFNKEQAEEERKSLMNALAKLKKERDFLDELVTVNESENARLTTLLNEARQEISTLKNRRWWHLLFPAKN